MSHDPRQVLVEICHLMAARNFTTSTGGNVSARMPDGTFWVTPSRLHKARVEIDDLVRIDEQLNVVEGTRRPSSEMLVHLAMYRALPMAGAVVHAHPPYATGFAHARKPISTLVTPEAEEILGKKVPLIPYEFPGTVVLADLVEAAMSPDYKAYLLANHGVLTWGVDLWESYDMLDILELHAQSLVVATLLGGAVPFETE